MTRPPPSSTFFPSPPLSLFFWINISATFFTVPASKSRASWVQGCFSALDSNLSQGSLRRLQCTGLLFCLPLLASAWFWLDPRVDRKSTRLNSSHLVISYAVF